MKTARMSLVAGGLAAFAMTAHAQLQPAVPPVAPPVSGPPPAVTPPPAALVGPQSVMPLPATAPSAEQAAFPAPKLITLTARDQPLREVLQQFQNQSGVQVNVNPRGPVPGNIAEKKITLDLRDKPIWEALLAILKEADDQPAVFFNVGTPQRGMYTVGGIPAINGPFMVIASRVLHDTPLQPTGVQPDRLTLELRVLVDPSLNISRLSYQSTPTRAVDDKGNNLIPPQIQPSGSYMSNFSPSSFNVPNVNLLLQCPPADVAGRNIAVIEGELTATFSKTEEIEIAPGQKLDRRVGAVKITGEWGPTDSITLPDIARGRPVAGNAPFTAVLRIEADDTLSPQEWGEWQSLMNSSNVRLLDGAGGQVRTMGSSSTTSGAPRARTIVARFGPPAGGEGNPPPIVKAVVLVPISNRTLPIPYRFQNIPLP